MATWRTIAKFSINILNMVVFYKQQNSIPFQVLVYTWNNLEVDITDIEGVERQQNV